MSTLCNFCTSTTRPRPKQSDLAFFSKTLHALGMLINYFFVVSNMKPTSKWIEYFCLLNLFIFKIDALENLLRLNLCESESPNLNENNIDQTHPKATME